MRKILTTEENLPGSWIANFRVGGLLYGNKSGTTDMKDPKTGKKLPRDGWLVGYTPSKVAVFRAGNTQGNPMNVNAYGGWVNGKTFRQFFTNLLKQNLIQSENVSPIEVKDVTVSKITGKLATESTPADQKVTSMAYIGTAPSAADSGITPIQVDSACMGKISDVTPQADIINGYLFKPTSFMPNNMDLDDINNWRKQKAGMGTGTTATTGDISIPVGNLFLEEPTKTCDNRPALGAQDDSIVITLKQPKENGKIAQTFSVRYDISAAAPISKIRIMLDNQDLGDFAHAGG